MSGVTTYVQRSDEREAKELQALDRAVRGLSDQNSSLTPQPTNAQKPLCRMVELICAKDVPPEQIDWLWPGWLAPGKLHVLAGKPATGKTTIALDLSACVSAARPFPDGWCPRRANVVIWSGEDDAADTIIPRLIAAGANLERIQIVGDVRESSGHLVPFDPASDVPALAAAMANLGDVSLIVVDPLVAAVRGNSHRNAEVRRGLSPLVELATKHGAALLGITHFSKNTSGCDLLERVTGSLAFGAVPRVVLATGKRPERNGELTRLALARVKTNNGPEGDGFCYGFEQTEIAGYEGLLASRIAWGEALEGSAHELLEEPDTSGSRTESDECTDWLREELKDGARDAASMIRNAAKLGHSQKIVRRARKTGDQAVQSRISRGLEMGTAR